VKLRYESILKSMQLDTGFVRPLVSFFQKKYPTVDVEAIFTEFVDIVMQEADYHQELRNHHYFAKRINEFTGAHVPRPVDEWCSSEVLTMEWASGIPLSEFLANASQEQRNRCGETIFRVICEILFKDSLFNTD